MEDNERSTRLTRTISRVTGYLGSFPAILIAGGLVAGWIAFSFLFLRGGTRIQSFEVLTTIGTAATFIMVFIIQNTQNRECRAV